MSKDSKSTKKATVSKDTKPAEKSAVSDDSKPVEKSAVSEDSKPSEKTTVAGDSKPTEKAIVSNDVKPTEKRATGETPVFDFTKLMSQFRLPGVDFAALVDRERKNIEALTKANRIAFEGWQRLVRSYIVLGRQDEARDALARGVAALGGKSPEAETLQAFAASLGLTRAE